MQTKETVSTRTARLSTCDLCKIAYTHERSSAKYCSDRCRNTARNKRIGALRSRKSKRRLLDKSCKLFNTKFGGYLVDECCRAGTVEILTGHTKASLFSLYHLHTMRTKYSGFYNGKSIEERFELSHISPVAGKQTVGLLHPENLIIAPSFFNRKRARTESSSGLSIKRSDLKTEWQISETDTKYSVQNKIRKFIGSEFDEFTKSLKIHLTAREKNIRKLIKLNNNDDDPDNYERKLRSLDSDAIEQLVREQKGRAYENNYTSPTRHPLLVAAAELKRFNLSHSIQYSLCHLAVDSSVSEDYLQRLLINCMTLLHSDLATCTQLEHSSQK